jgi:hypothetical protein
MSATNGHIRKLTEGLVMYTDELYHKSYAGEPTKNLLPTAVDNSDWSARLGSGDPEKKYHFWRVYKDEDPYQQGMFKSLSPGSMMYKDIVYKCIYPDSPSNALYGMHTFSGSDHNTLYLNIGTEYTFSCEVFVSKTHNRTTKSLWPVISIKATDQSKSYGYYDFSKKGTWQTVSILVKPSLRSTVTATSGTEGTAGTTGTSGTSGTSGVVLTSLHHTAYFWPSETAATSEYSSGYILYKNPQLEKNRAKYAGVAHRTQFTSSSRSKTGGLKDLSGNKNSLSLAKSKFDKKSRPVFSKGIFYNLGVTSTEVGHSPVFKVNSTTKKSYEFWVNLSSVNNGISTLLYSDLTQGGNFTSKENVSRKQHIFISQGRIHCYLYDEFGFVYSSFTQQVCVSDSTVAHIIISIDMTLSSNKISFFVNGYTKSTSSVSSLLPPKNLSLATYPIYIAPGGDRGFTGQQIHGTDDDGGKEHVEKYGSLPKGLEGTGLEKAGEEAAAAARAAAAAAQKAGWFDINATMNYKVSSYNEDGESRASLTKKVFVKRSNLGVSLSWSNVSDAKSFYVYKSETPLGKFSNISLLTIVPNPHFGVDNEKTISFLDNGNSVLSFGQPKSEADYSKYNLKNTTFYDGSDLKLSIGDFPKKNKTKSKTHSDGKIYKISVYNKALSSSEALDSYIQGYRDFDTITTAVNYDIGY